MAAAIAGYGDELFGFVIGLTRDHARADDVFGATCERLWRALPQFRWESSLRVWAYTVARNEFLRSIRQVVRDRRAVPLPGADSTQQALLALAERVRVTTPVYAQTAVKDRFAKLRETLAPEDHMLLGLRIDRGMAWTDIARVLGTPEADAAVTTREAAAFRKRFERLKARLRELANET